MEVSVEATRLVEQVGTTIHLCIPRTAGDSWGVCMCGTPVSKMFSVDQFIVGKKLSTREIFKLTIMIANSVVVRGCILVVCRGYGGLVVMAPHSGSWCQ
ncbi:hypothetical protein TNCV_2340021 [Trichonephila clavipes]|nr:hypothetical protein TNCV_2340021 [Trichonephila clavipes]